MNDNERQGWVKAKPIRHVLPSGRVCYLRRPSPSLVLKTGKIQRLLSRAAKPSEAQSVDEAGWAFLAALDDSEAERLAQQAIDLVIDVMVEPKLYREPNENQLGVTDLGTDFWPLYSKAMMLFNESPVELKDGGFTTVEAVETFSDGSATDIVSSDDGEQIQGAPC